MAKSEEETEMLIQHASTVALLILSILRIYFCVLTQPLFSVKSRLRQYSEHQENSPLLILLLLFSKVFQSDAEGFMLKDVESKIV